jgi:hypothetical protein
MSKEIPFEKSFASHEKSKYWSNKNELKPDIFIYYIINNILNIYIINYKLLYWTPGV